MNQKEIIATIQRRRAAGLMDEQIKAALINQGLTDEEVNGFIESSYKMPPVTDEEIKAEQKSSARAVKKWWWPF